jgi:uroporphyrinogen decarboxylase
VNPKERVINAINFRETDIVPYHIGFTKPAHQKMAAYFKDEDFESKLGNHFLLLTHNRRNGWVEVKPNYFQDEFGVVWNRTVDKDIGVVDKILLTEPTLKGFDFPDPNEEGLFDHYNAAIAANPDKFCISQIGFSLFERAWTLRGMENLLVDMIENPTFVHELLDAICDYNIALIDRALHYDIDACYFGDDWGSQRGLIMGEARWREFIKPRVARMYARVREAGRFVVIHSCGKVQSLFPDLIECGVNIFNPFQPEVMDPYEMKQLYGDKLAFYGGISIQKLLPYGTPDEVRTEVNRMLKEIGRGGGYIAGPSHDLPGDIPAENIAAMIDVLCNQQSS